MAKDLRDLKKLVESYYEDMPTGEYEVCTTCFGAGCEACEHGLKDITGQHKMPDTSSMEDCEYCHNTGYVNETDPQTGEVYRDACTFCGAFLRNAGNSLTEDDGYATLHVDRDDWPQMVILKRHLAKYGITDVQLQNSRFGESYIAVKFPREKLPIAKEVLVPYREDNDSHDSWGRRSAYGSAEYVGNDMPQMTKYSILDSKMAEGFSSPPPLGDMIKAGFPDVAPGDRIRTRKGDHTGVVTKLRVHPQSGTEEVFFTDDVGKKFKTPLSNVLRVSDMKEESNELEEGTMQFKDGDKVRLKPEYADDPNEVFWVSQCDYDRNRCWIGDAQGRGWYASFGQLVPAKKKKKSFAEETTNEGFVSRLEMEYDGFGYYFEVEEEDDNSKIWHYAVLPNGKEETLDLSPYSDMDADTFRAFVEYYKQHGRFPQRTDIGSIGPLYKEDVQGLVESSLWSSLGEAMSVEEKITIFEEYYVKGNLTEAIDENKKTQFLELFNLSEQPVESSRYIVVPLILVSNKPVLLAQPTYMKYVGENGKGLRFSTGNELKTYPPKIIRDLSIAKTFTFSTIDAYDKFRFILNLGFGLDLPEVNILGDEMKEAKGDSIDRMLARMQSPKYLEKRAIDQLKSLQQPITVNGGSYAYRANMKNPYAWQASDGSPIKIKKLAEIGDYFDKWVQEEWNMFLDDEQDVDDLVRMGIVRQGAAGAYRDQSDYEHKQMLGDSVGNDVPEYIYWAMLQGMRGEMRRVAKEAGLELDGQGYDESSTKWQMVFLNTKRLTPDQWDSLLRVKLGGWPNWMEVESADDMFDSPVYESEGALKEETNMDSDMDRLLKLAGMYHKPQVFEMENNEEGDKSPLSDVTDFVADVRGEKPKDPTKFNNVDGDKSVLSEDDVEEGWDPFQDELEDDDYYDDYDDQSQEDFPGRSRRFANPGSALYAADERNPRIHACPTCGGPNRLTQRDIDAGYQCDGCANAAEFGLDMYHESIEESEGGEHTAFRIGSELFDSNPDLDVNSDEFWKAAFDATAAKLGRKTAKYVMNYDEDYFREVATAYADRTRGEEVDWKLSGEWASEKVDEADVEEDYLVPPKQPDPHANEDVYADGEEAEDWYDPEDARRQVARMGANPEFTGKHEVKPYDPVADQEREDEWIRYQNAEQEQMAAMDDWDVFSKQGVEEAGLNNGYGEHHAVDGEDFFPSGATSNVSKKVGPSGARHGDNPMSKKMTVESAKIYEQYKRDFDSFKKK